MCIFSFVSLVEENTINQLFLSKFQFVENSYCLFVAKLNFFFQPRKIAQMLINSFHMTFVVHCTFYNNNCFCCHRDSFHLVVKTCEKCLCLGVKMFNRGKCGAVLFAIFFLPMPKGANFRVITDT